MLHQGQPQTFASALPTLLRLRRNAGMLRASLGCRGRPALHPLPSHARDVPDLDWSVCPLDLLDGPHLRATLDVARLARVSPLAGWPRGWSAWLVGALPLVVEG